jgi:lysozyme
MSEKINLLVVDLSHFDGTVDYHALKEAGIVGVIYKATEGVSYGDSTYLSSKRRALQAGLLWGSYHFGTSDEIAAQVSNYLNYAAPTIDELMCLDYEPNGSQTMSEEQAVEWVKAVETGLGRPGDVVLYSGNLIKETATQPNYAFWGARRLWLAQYGETPMLPAPWKNYWLWQYTDGTVGPAPHGAGGILSCDCNSFPGTPEQLSDQWATGLEVPL